MENLLVVGGGGHGRVVAEAAALTSRFDHIQFVEKTQGGPGEIDGFRASSGDPDPAVFSTDDWSFIVGIGDNRVREAVQARIAARGYRAISLVHPAAFVSIRARLGAGSVVLAGAVVQTGARVGDGAIVNNRASIDHDSVVGRFSHIAPGAVLAGDVTVGDFAFIGAGTAVRNGVSIAGGVTTGVGTVVARDIAEAGVYVGVPARLLRPAMDAAKPGG